jgi:hypothetical protein
MSDSLKMKVMGEEIELDRSQLLIMDIGEDMDNVASQVSYFGSLWAEAEREEMAADTYYRAWRAKEGEKILASDPKMAEWKVRQEIEASSQFTVIKEQLAIARRNSVALRGHFEAFKVKASILQSKGAMRRAEMESTGIGTRTGGDPSMMREVREDAVRTTFKSKRGE